RFRWDDPVTPATDAEYDVARRHITILRRRDMPGLRLADCRVERMEVPGRGARIPLTVMRRCDQVEPTAFVFYVYGAYGLPLEERFWVLPFSLLDRGVGYAVCHVRGGGEFGPPWWKAGAGRQKSIGVDDFIACTEYLVARGIADPRRLGTIAESAGAF